MAKKVNEKMEVTQIKNSESDKFECWNDKEVQAANNNSLPQQASKSTDTTNKPSPNKQPEVGIAPSKLLADIDDLIRTESNL